MSEVLVARRGGKLSRQKAAVLALKDLKIEKHQHSISGAASKEHSWDLAGKPVIAVWYDAIFDGVGNLLTGTSRLKTSRIQRDSDGVYRWYYTAAAANNQEFYVFYE